LCTAIFQRNAIYEELHPETKARSRGDQPSDARALSMPMRFQVLDLSEVAFGSTCVASTSFEQVR